jgi:hypothetical protein
LILVLPRGRRLLVHGGDGGRVTDGTSGLALSTATIVLERRLVENGAGNTGTLPLPVRAEFDKESNFTIRAVTPGSYQLWADGTAEGREWKGVFRIEGSSDQASRAAPRVTLEPRSERGAIAEAAPRFNAEPFPVTRMPDETYDVFVRNLPDTFFVSAVRVNGTDMRALGIYGAMARSLPFEIVLDSRGGRLDGRVYGPNGGVWSGASLVLIPDSPADHLQSYRQTAADEYGIFQIPGIPPGRYTLVAWLDNPDGLEGCRTSGTTVTVAANSWQTVALNVKTLRAR